MKREYKFWDRRAKRRNTRECEKARKALRRMVGRHDRLTYLVRMTLMQHVQAFVNSVQCQRSLHDALFPHLRYVPSESGGP
jgi:hypothetical protein